MNFNFDEEINRHETPALKWQQSGPGLHGLFPGAVADMDFKAPPMVLAAMQARLDHGVFGYETLPEGLLPALLAWLESRHGWRVEPGQILRAPNVLNAMAMAISTFTRPGDGLIVQPPVFLIFMTWRMKTGARSSPTR